MTSVLAGVMVLSMPAMGEDLLAQECVPACRTGFLCHRGECVSACNPPCEPGSICTSQGECVSACNPPCPTAQRCLDTGECAASMAPVAAPPPVASPAMTLEESNDKFLVRALLAFDPIAAGLAYGVGVGYRFALGPGTSEVVADVYISPSYDDRWVDGGWQYDESIHVLIVAARFNWLFGYSEGQAGLFPIVGGGFFAGNVSWEQSWHLIDDWSYGDRDSAEHFASGLVLSPGLGYAFSSLLEARLELVVMVYFGDYGTSAVSVPLTANLGFRF
jgi:hypothetical protein